jgi:anaerobic selenocysteine-containing dehydrogenase
MKRLLVAAVALAGLTVFSGAAVAAGKTNSVSQRRPCTICDHDCMTYCYNMTGKVVRDSGGSLVISTNGKEVSFSTARLVGHPEVGQTLRIFYAKASNGQLEAMRFQRH